MSSEGVPTVAGIGYRFLSRKVFGAQDADALYQGGYEQLLRKAGWLKDASDRVVSFVNTEAKDPKAAAATNSRPNAMENLVTAYNDLIEQSNQTMYSKTMK